MSWSTWRTVVADHTEPSPAAVERVRARVLAAAQPTTAALRAAEPPLDGRAEARVRAALRDRVRARRPALGWLALGGGVAFAFAGGAWWVGAPTAALSEATRPAVAIAPEGAAEAPSAATWLARANERLAAGDPQGALDATETGMPLADDAIAGELLAVQADAWLALGQPAAARAAAEAYLTQAHRPRSQEMRHLAGDLALTDSDCAAARRWLADLPDLSAPEEAHLARCTSP